MQRNQHLTTNIYGHKVENPRKSAQSPSTAASGGSLIGQSLKIKQRNNSLNATASTNQKISRKLNMRKNEFLDLVNRFQSKSSLNQE